MLLLLLIHLLQAVLSHSARLGLFNEVSLSFVENVPYLNRNSLCLSSYFVKGNMRPYFM